MPKLTREEHIEVFLKVHNDLYDYSGLPEKIKSDTKLPIRCKKHNHIFNPTYHTHKKGIGCPICGRERSEAAKFNTEETFLQKLKNKHGDTYDLSKVIKRNKKGTDHIIVGCRVHGDFEPQISNFMYGKGCKKCDVDSRRKSKEHFIKDGNVKHKDKFDYSKVIYIDNKTPVTITCPIHGDFKQIPNSHTNGNGCSKCSFYVSKAEQEIAEFISKYIDIKQSDKKQLEGNELDIYIPSKNFAVEYDGLYWHSEKYKDKNYHKRKQEKCQEKEIRLIQVYEDEWLHKKDIVKSRLLNNLGFTEEKIFGRKCILKEVNSKTAMQFLEANHIQGKLGAKVRVGLYHNEELVSLMTFGGLRKNLGNTSKEGSYELLRFCNKLNTTVVGAASKLLKYFEIQYKPQYILSYADRRWSDGNLYKVLGFDNTGATEPNYYYTEGRNRLNRFNYRKSELVKMGYDINKSENQITGEMGLKRIYDSGSIRFVKEYLTTL